MTSSLKEEYKLKDIIVIYEKGADWREKGIKRTNNIYFSQVYRVNFIDHHKYQIKLIMRKIT
jgi:hypothetical protein